MQRPDYQQGRLGAELPAQGVDGVPEARRFVFLEVVEAESSSAAAC